MTDSLRLKHVASVFAGQSPPSSEVSIFDGTDGAPFLQGNAEFGVVHPSPVYQSATAPRRAHAGDILVSVRAPVGAVNVADREYGIGRGLAAVRARMIDPGFARWLIEHSAQWLNSIATGSTFTAVSGADVGNVVVPVHDLVEQRAIADYLDRETAQIDAFIAKNEELIDLLVERRAAVVTALIVGGLDPKLVTVDVSGIGRLPAHWIVDRFARVAQVRGGLLSPNDQRFETLPLIAPNHVESKTGRLLALVPASEQSAESGKYAARAGDVIYSKIRPVLAKVVLAPEDCLCSADMYAITSRSSGVLSNEFLRWQMLSKWFTEWAAERSMRVAMPKINQDTLASAPLVLPPIDEQREIVDRIDRDTVEVDRAIAAARDVVQLARERRAALISAAVTGKIDVGVAA